MMLFKRVSVRVVGVEPVAIGGAKFHSQQGLREAPTLLLGPTNEIAGIEVTKYCPNGP